MTRLVPASLEAPAGLLEFIREIGEGENGFRGEGEVVSGALRIEAFLQRLVDWSAGLNLSEGWVPFTTFWLLDDDGSVAGVSRLRQPPASQTHRLPAQPRRARRLLRGAGAARQGPRHADSGADAR